MRLFSRWYGANPLHLLTMIACLALAAYAAADLLAKNPVGIVVWLVGAVVGHDIILFPLYTLADRSILVIFRHRRPRLPAVPWINYLRVPVVLSGILLLIWFPLIFRLPKRFAIYTTLSIDPYLTHWLVITGALFLLSAVAYAIRLRLAPAEAAPASTRGKHTRSALTEDTPYNNPVQGNPPWEGAPDGTPPRGSRPGGPSRGGAPWDDAPGAEPRRRGAPGDPPAWGSPPGGPPRSGGSRWHGPPGGEPPGRGAPGGIPPWESAPGGPARGAAPWDDAPGAEPPRRGAPGSLPPRRNRPDGGGGPLPRG